MAIYFGWVRKLRARGPVRVLAAAVTGALALGLAGCEPVTGLEPAEQPSGRHATRGAKGQTSVPLRVITERGATLVLVPVKVNGRGPYHFILDTGASTSSVDRRLARRLGLPRTGETADVRGVTGSAVVPVVRVRAWTLGGKSLRGRTMTVTDVGDARVSGLLGSDELRRFGAVTLDYRRERLLIR